MLLFFYNFIANNDSTTIKRSPSRPNTRNDCHSFGGDVWLGRTGKDHPHKLF